MPRVSQEPSAIIDEMFPEVPWTGSSHIHRSFARNINVDVPHGSRGAKKLITMLAHAKFGLGLYEFLQETFMGCEWLIDYEEFTKLVLVDIWLGMLGQPKSVTQGMIQNPRTGNVFHRIALRDGQVVCGIRFWAENSGEGTTLGYRFRVALLEEGEEPKVRHKIQELIQETETTYSEMMAEVQIQDPSEAELAEARLRLRMEE